LLHFCCCLFHCRQWFLSLTSFWRLPPAH
jgi:hypothetical protein